MEVVDLAVRKSTPAVLKMPLRDCGSTSPLKCRNSANTFVDVSSFPMRLARNVPGKWPPNDSKLFQGLCDKSVVRYSGHCASRLSQQQQCQRFPNSGGRWILQTETQGVISNPTFFSDRDLVLAGAFLTLYILDMNWARVERPRE